MARLYVPPRNIEQFIASIALWIDRELPFGIVARYQLGACLGFSLGYTAELFCLNHGNGCLTGRPRNVELIGSLLLVGRERIHLDIQEIFTLGILREFASFYPRRQVVELQAVGREIAVDGEGLFATIGQHLKAIAGIDYRQIGTGDIHVDKERRVQIAEQCGQCILILRPIGVLCLKQMHIGIVLVVVVIVVLVAEPDGVEVVVVEIANGDQNLVINLYRLLKYKWCRIHADTRGGIGLAQLDITALAHGRSNCLFGRTVFGAIDSQCQLCVGFGIYVYTQGPNAVNQIRTAGLLKKIGHTVQLPGAPARFGTHAKDIGIVSTRNRNLTISG